MSAPGDVCQAKRMINVHIDDTRLQQREQLHHLQLPLPVPGEPGIVCSRGEFACINRLPCRVAALAASCSNRSPSEATVSAVSRVNTQGHYECHSEAARRGHAPARGLPTWSPERVCVAVSFLLRITLFPLRTATQPVPQSTC